MQGHADEERLRKHQPKGWVAGHAARTASAHSVSGVSGSPYLATAVVTLTTQCSGGLEES
jgi:hypothetical protein